MSELARTYYESRADRLGVGHDEIPSVLDGEAVRLMDPGDSLSLRGPDDEALEGAVTKLDGLLATTHDFVRAGIPSDIWQPPDVQPDRAAANRRFLRHAIGGILLEGSMRTGDLRGIAVEAVARTEINDEAVKKAPRDRLPGFPREPGSREYELSEAYLVLSSVATSGPTMRDDRRALLVVRAVDLRTPQRHASIQYTGARLVKRGMSTGLAADDLRASEPGLQRSYAAASSQSLAPLDIHRMVGRRQY